MPLSRAEIGGLLRGSAARKYRPQAPCNNPSDAVLLGFAVGLLPTFRPPRASSPRLLPKALKVPQPSRSAVLLGEPMVPRPSRLAALPKALMVPQPSRSAVLLGEPMVPRPSRLAALNFAERPIAHFLREPSRTGHQSAIREPIRPRSSS